MTKASFEIPAQSKIPETIRERRKANRLSQKELGCRLGVSAQAVSKWERGLNLPDLLLLPALCDVLGITAEELLRACAPPPRKEPNTSGHANGKS